MTTKAQAINKVVALSRSQLGTHEYGNRVKYGDWYASRHGAGWASALWCNIYISWVFNKCGYAKVNGGDYASTVSQYNWCRANAKRVSFSQARAGDLMFFRFPTSGGRAGNVVNHIDLVVGSYRNGYVPTHGGNTPKPGTYGDPSNGRGVWAHQRSSYAVVAVFRLPWGRVTSAAQAGSDAGSKIAKAHIAVKGTLREGDRGKAVRNLQKYLNSRGSVKPKLKADGVFGNKTDRGLKQWQRANGLKADGIWGVKSKAKRRQLKRRRLHVHGRFPLPAGHYYGVNDKRIHSHSGARERDRKNVKRIQRTVGVHADGKFGPKTKNAVESFQHRYGLGRDGKVGPRTWRRMSKKTG